LGFCVGELPLNEIDADAAPRRPLAWDEFNRVLGGGIVPGSLVLIGGEPGVGKSRLALEVRNLVGSDPHRWVESSCASYTRMSVLRPVVDLIEDTLSLRSESDPAARLERIRSGLALAGVGIPDGAEIVASLLGVEQVGIDDNFFMLGGHSLLGTQVIMRIVEAFGVEMPLRTIFNAPTVRLLAAEIEQRIVARLEAMSDEEVLRLLQ